ncbi:hypothetical protein EXIGLDRAFT_749094 [Exidia glandulosa HHB12029]|uniref:Protein kinase domain-containing protein n=1 Tax=Exidia glandulosa HHB12029 TaxID=1314781 RepID=A0A165ILC3_EXIGL|nr:hypothetical protein EXIGLDRAFT_749094 [Exidia glandulosa HHB12029]
MSSPTPSDAQTPADTPTVAPVPAPPLPLSLKEHLALKPAADRRVLLLQVAVFLAFYHVVERVIHGDVKLTSVFVNDSGDAQLPKSRSTVPITSLPRAPTNPEERLPMTTATDVYAFAWLVFYAFTDIDPQVLARNPQTMRLIASGVKPNRPGPGTLPHQRGLNDTIWSMLVRCWDISPAARPPITEVLLAFNLPAPTVNPLPAPPPPYEARPAGGGGPTDAFGSADADDPASTDGSREASVVGSAATAEPTHAHAPTESVDRQRDTEDNDPGPDTSMSTEGDDAAN